MFQGPASPAMVATRELVIAGAHSCFNGSLLTANRTSRRLGYSRGRTHHPDMTGGPSVSRTGSVQVVETYLRAPEWLPPVHRFTFLLS
jgi:hypothetical protein